MVQAAKRLSNIEALRIVALIMVVAIHASEPGVLTISPSNGGWAFADLVDSLSRVGVDVFILIAAYFLCTINLTPKGIARRWFLLLYPVLIMALFYLIFPLPSTLSEVTGFFSLLMQGIQMDYHGVSIGHLWYIYPFLFMVALSPIMNYAINSMSRETYKKALAILIVVLVVPQTIEYFTTTNVLFNVNDALFFFITLYFVAGYIRKFDLRIRPRTALALWLSTAISISALIGIYTLVVQPPSTFLSKAYVAFYNHNDLLVMSGAIFLFITFRQLELKNRAISLCGKFTYDAYLIHILILYAILREWPFNYSPGTSPLSYSTQLLTIITVVVILSLGYGMLRYAMDEGLKALLERAAIGRRTRVREISGRVSAILASFNASL